MKQIKNRPLLKFLIILYALSLNFQSFALIEGDKVGNGGGVAEQNFSYAFINLSKILKLCFISNNCLKTKRESSTLLKIEKSLSKEYKMKKPLIFLSGKKNPKIFKIEGSYRTAVTGDQIGDSIYINVDLIYNRSSRNGNLNAMSISSAIGLLIHELGHHHQIYNHDFLDLLGSRLRAFSLNQLDIIRPDLYFDQINIRPPIWSLTAIHSRMYSGSDLNGAETQLLFADEKHVYDLEKWIMPVLKICPKDPPFKKSNLLGYRLYYFRRGPWIIRERSVSRRTYTFKASVEMFCESLEDYNYPVRFETKYDIQIKIPINFLILPKFNSYWKVQTDQIEIKLIPMERLSNFSQSIRD